MSSTIFNLKYKKIVPALPGIVLTIIESIMSDIAFSYEASLWICFSSWMYFCSTTDSLAAEDKKVESNSHTLQ